MNKIVLVSLGVVVGLILGISVSVLGIKLANESALAACNGYCETAPDEISKLICSLQCSQIITGSNCLRYPPTDIPNT